MPFSGLGDLVIGKASIIVGVHDSTQAWTEPVSFCIPPLPKPLPLAAYIWQTFNKVEYSMSLARAMSPFWLNPTVVLWHCCHPLWFWHLFPMESDPCIIYIHSVLTWRLLLTQLSYLLIASVPPLMDHLTLIWPIVDSGLNFIRMITPTFMPFCHLNARRGLD
jgi:hypothetical protein